MKGLNIFSRRGFSARFLLIVAAFPAIISQAQVTLTDGNSVALLEPTSQAGMYYWAVQNTPNTYQNQLNQQWFWYRVGSDPERSIDTISAPSITALTAGPFLSICSMRPKYFLTSDTAVYWPEARPAWSWVMVVSSSSNDLILTRGTVSAAFGFRAAHAGLAIAAAHPIAASRKKRLRVTPWR